MPGNLDLKALITPDETTVAKLKKKIAHKLVKNDPDQYPNEKLLPSKMNIIHDSENLSDETIITHAMVANNSLFSCRLNLTSWQQDRYKNRFTPYPVKTEVKSNEESSEDESESENHQSKRPQNSF